MDIFAAIALFAIAGMVLTVFGSAAIFMISAGIKDLQTPGERAAGVVGILFGLFLLLLIVAGAGALITA